MLDEVARLIDAGPGATYVDATVGYGGHAERLAELAGLSGRVIGIDRDAQALEAARRRLSGFGGVVTLVRRRFSEIDAVAREEGVTRVDGVLFDLGVSSPQLSSDERGFSFRGSSRLDMRMDPSQGPTAGELVNELDEAELSRILREFGEEKWASRIASFIVEARRREVIDSTERLVEIIKAAVPASARRGDQHPGRRVFQALRIAVNDELSELRTALEKVPKLLRGGGRVVVISYHSLEDRIVKSGFRQAERGCRCPPDFPECRCGGRPTLRVLTKRPVVPEPSEVAGNPRARSARLRAAEKVEVEGP